MIGKNRCCKEESSLVVEEKEGAKISYPYDTGEQDLNSKEQEASR